MTIHGCGTCGTTWTAPVTSCPEWAHDPTQRDPRVQRMIDDPQAYFADAREQIRRESEQVCRCGRRAADTWRCGHPEVPPLRCRLGFHKFSLPITWPAGANWCDRCGLMRHYRRWA